MKCRIKYDGRAIWYELKFFIAILEALVHYSETSMHLEGYVVKHLTLQVKEY